MAAFNVSTPATKSSTGVLDPPLKLREPSINCDRRLFSCVFRGQWLDSHSSIAFRDFAAECGKQLWEKHLPSSTVHYLHSLCIEVRIPIGESRNCGAALHPRVMPVGASTACSFELSFGAWVGPPASSETIRCSSAVFPDPDSRFCEDCAGAGERTCAGRCCLVHESRRIAK